MHQSKQLERKKLGYVVLLLSQNLRVITFKNDKLGNTNQKLSLDTLYKNLYKKNVLKAVIMSITTLIKKTLGIIKINFRAKHFEIC